MTGVLRNALVMGGSVIALWMLLVPLALLLAVSLLYFFLEGPGRRGSKGHF